LTKAALICRYVSNDDVRLMQELNPFLLFGQSIRTYLTKLVKVRQSLHNTATQMGFIAV